MKYILTHNKCWLKLMWRPRQTSSAPSHPRQNDIILLSKHLLRGWHPMSLNPYVKAGSYFRWSVVIVFTTINDTTINRAVTQLYVNLVCTQHWCYTGCFVSKGTYLQHEEHNHKCSSSLKRYVTGKRHECCIQGTQNTNLSFHFIYLLIMAN